jgi:flagellar hook-associated protein 1 FlgK
MAGLNDLLNIGKSALQTQQRALNVTGHNIANATTPGYVRQTLGIIEAVPFRTPQGLVGRGVTDTGVYAQRDTFLDASYRNEQSGYSQSNLGSNMLGQVQSLFGDDADSGLAASLDNFFGSFSDLANDPSSNAQRVVVRQDANGVINQLHAIASGLDDVTTSAQAQFHDGVDQINSITQQIATLNAEIVAEGGPNHTAPDLENQRGNLLDKLSGLTDIRVLNRDDGSVGVIAGDTLLVDGGVAQTLDVRTGSGISLEMGVAGDAKNVKISGGSQAGLQDLLTTALPGVRSQIDQFAGTLVASVNAIHSTAPSGYNFFDPAGTTAATIGLSTQVAASATNISAGATASAGDNSVATRLAALRDVPQASLGGATVGDYYRGIVTTVGSQVANATQAATAANTVLSSVSTQRASETGVSTDEELTTLISQQQAYSAAAHLITVADDLMQTLLQMI